MDNIDPQQPATLGEVSRIVQESEQRITERLLGHVRESEQRIIAHVRESEERILAYVHGIEDRITERVTERVIERVTEIMRDMQTELLRGFEAFTAGMTIRVRKLEADQSNLDSALSGRMDIMERRLRDIEIRLGGAPPTP